MEGRYAHELRAGDQYAPLEFVVTPELNQQFLYAVEDFDSRYLLGRDDKPPLVHPVVLLHMTPRTRSPSYRQAPGMGSAFARDRSRYVNPAYVATPLRVTWTITSTYEQRGKIYQDYVAAVHDADGVLILQRELASTFFSRGTVKTFALEGER
jgi:hypothetical protein